jgi:hypothetical protein
MEVKVKKFYGLPPYDEMSNTTRGDGYFAKAFERDHKMTIADAANRLGIKIKVKS